MGLTTVLVAFAASVWSVAMVVLGFFGSWSVLRHRAARTPEEVSQADSVALPAPNRDHPVHDDVPPGPSARGFRTTTGEELLVVHSDNSDWSSGIQDLIRDKDV